MPRSLVAIPLIVESVLTMAYVASLAPMLGVYGVATLAVVGARFLVGAVLLAGGWMLMAGRPAARALARSGLVASAALWVPEVGLRLSPSNLDPSFRWLAVATYGVYAAFMIALLARARPTG
jgi:hypothetical protein